MLSIIFIENNLSINAYINSIMFNKVQENVTPEINKGMPASASTSIPAYNKNILYYFVSGMFFLVFMLFLFILLAMQK